MRLLLGAAEAGFFPGIIFYLTLWFRARCLAGAQLPATSCLGAFRPPVSLLILTPKPKSTALRPRCRPRPRKRSLRQSSVVVGAIALPTLGAALLAPLAFVGIAFMFGAPLWAEANEPRGAVFQFTLPAGQEDS